MAKKKRELTTRRMPSGGQQYVRPAETGRERPVADRMRTINKIISRSQDPEVGRTMTEALLDESVLARIGDMNERQTRDEDYNNRIRDIRAGRYMKMSGGGLKKSMRPVPRPGTAKEREEERGAVERGNRAAEREAREADSLKPLRRKAGGTVKKMVSGGMCRGMGKATRGGNFSRG
jgi:hypothetical protein